MIDVVRLDGLASVFLGVAGLLLLVGALASRRTPDRRVHLALWGLVAAAATGVFVARDLVVFLVCWQTMLVGVAMLIARSGPAGRGAATHFAVTTLAGAAASLVAIVALGVARGSFDIDTLAARPIAPRAQILPALLCLFPFATALPLFPLHGWLGRAHAAAPAPVAMVLSGVVGTAAIYGILRICIPLFPQGMAALAPMLVAIAAVGALYSAIVAARQDDVRRLIAFASLSQLNLAGLALFAGTATSLRGAVLASLSHALVISALLLVASFLTARTSSFAVSRARGVATAAPVLSAYTLVVALAAIGLPGTSSFSAQAVVLVGVYERFPVATATAALAMSVAASYGLRVIRGAPDGAPAEVTDLRWRERLLVAPLLAASIVVGLAPQLVTDRIPMDVLPRTEVRE